MMKDIKAAIFDLDGTLLESMYVWQRVDEIFFERRGLPLSAEYGRALAGLSFEESADYTISYYGLKESKEEILKEWMDLARYEYANNVRMKAGAREFLSGLRRRGIRTAVATALPEELYRPCLENLGVIDMFDALCSTDDTGGRGKGRGEVYCLAADRVGADYGDCAVFEDVATGIRGAKHAGMRAVWIRNDGAKHDAEAIEAMADHVIDDYRALNAGRRCVIFTARCEGDPKIALGETRVDDMILCADAGWKIAAEAGVQPCLTIGDFDSADAPFSGRVIRHPVMKDDTDTMLCVKYAMAEGFRDFLIVGGLGGRIDHTLANLQTMMYIAERGGQCEMRDGRTGVTIVRNGSVSIPPEKGKLSVFAVGGNAKGVRIRNAKYELDDAEITCDFPIGMGNDFIGVNAEVSVSEGTILVIRDMNAE